ncbi:hypothetical protein B1R94_26560 [Mycolicibacterium litorale]|nr:hypothetical protein B1R94_26560 [Mycolicibacterium litorale]
MTESPERVDETATGPVATLPPPPPPPAPPVYYEPAPSARPSRLYQVAAWVAIVAGIVFITGAVFFTGFAMGRHSGGEGGWRHHGNAEFHHRGGPPMMPGPMMPGPGPGAWAPMGPGSGFGPMGPPPGATGPGSGATPAPRP